MAITKVGYGFARQSPADLLFEGIRANSERLESLKEAVLKHANSWLGVPNNPPPPALGAKWTDPSDQKKYNVVWNYVGPAQTATTVMVTNIAPRG